MLSENVALLEKYDFDDIVISLKSSDVKMNYEAYKIVNDRSDYPLHIGVTGGEKRHGAR